MLGPDLTVVVLPIVGEAALSTCLAGLDGEATRLVVAAPEQASEGLRRAAERLGARLLVGDFRTVPARRMAGLRAASGEVVALLEDTTVPGPGWIDAVRRTFADPRVAGAGGPISIATALPGRLQALGWSEYGAFHPGACDELATGPRRADGALPVRRLPGSNMAFRREAVLAVLDPDGDGLIEGVAGDRLRAAGRELVLQPAMAARFVSGDPCHAGLQARFHHGRLYGGGCAAERPWPARLALAGKAAALPLVLPLRTFRRVRAATRPGSLTRLMLWVGLLEAAWAAGEGVGALTGRGDSLQRWR